MTFRCSSEAFIETYTEKRGREKFSLSQQATSALLNYEWRGNVRELENLIQHMSVLYSGKHLELTDLPGEIPRPGNGT